MLTKGCEETYFLMWKPCRWPCNRSVQLMTSNLFQFSELSRFTAPAPLTNVPLLPPFRQGQACLDVDLLISVDCTVQYRTQSFPTSAIPIARARSRNDMCRWQPLTGTRAAGAAMLSGRNRPFEDCRLMRIPTQQLSLVSCRSRIVKAEYVSATRPMY